MRCGHARGVAGAHDVACRDALRGRGSGEGVEALLMVRPGAACAGKEEGGEGLLLGVVVVVVVVVVLLLLLLRVACTTQAAGCAGVRGALEAQQWLVAQARGQAGGGGVGGEGVALRAGGVEKQPTGFHAALLHAGVPRKHSGVQKAGIGAQRLQAQHTMHASAAAAAAAGGGGGGGG